MIPFKKIVIDVPSTVGEHFLFASYRPAYEYENGAPTTKIKGYRCQLILLDRQCSTLDVTVPTKPDVASGMAVCATDLELHLYQIKEKTVLTAKATAIVPAK